MNIKKTTKLSTLVPDFINYQTYDNIIKQVAPNIKNRIKYHYRTRIKNNYDQAIRELNNHLEEPLEYKRIQKSHIHCPSIKSNKIISFIKDNKLIKVDDLKYVDIESLNECRGIGEVNIKNIKSIL
tara:strand:+ start:224 stop:601 length:378 start_codon:yes stop_codon:yes gene_type:complete